MISEQDMTVVVMSTKLLVSIKLQETGFCVENPENYYLNRSILYKKCHDGKQSYTFPKNNHGRLLFFLKKRTPARYL